MSIYSISHISAFSVLIPFVAAYWKRRSMGRKYFLLIALLIVGAVNDLISLMTIIHKGNNTVNSNIYQLVEFALIVWMLRKRLYESNGTFHAIILIIGTFTWTLDNLVLHTIFDNNSIFRLIAPILIVFACVDKINYVLLNRSMPSTVPDILIIVALLVYHAYRGFLESFQLFPVKMVIPFYMKLWFIQCLLSILTNITFAIAFLCLRFRSSSTILSSPPLRY